MNVCNYCKGEFIPTNRKDQKYCSKTCQNKANERRRKEREKEKTELQKTQANKEPLDLIELALKSAKDRRKKLRVNIREIKEKLEAQKQYLVKLKKSKAKDLTNYKKSDKEFVDKINKSVEAWSSWSSPFSKLITNKEKREKNIVILEQNIEVFKNQREKGKQQYLSNNKLWDIMTDTTISEIKKYEQDIEQLEQEHSDLGKLIGEKEEERERLIANELMKKEVLTREERRLINKYREVLEFDGEWLEFLGRPYAPFRIIIFGHAGAGKGFFCIQFAKYLSENFGKVAYISPEEAADATLDHKLDRYEVTEDPNKFITATSDSLPKIEKVIQEQQPKFVFIDSITVCGMQNTDLLRLKKLFPKVSFIAIVQTDKQGAIRGSAKLEHDCQVLIQVERGIANTEKKIRTQGWSKRRFEIFDDLKDKAAKE